MDQDYQNDEFQLQEGVSNKPKPKPLLKTSDDTTGYSVSHLPKVVTKDKELLKKYSAINLINRNKLHSLGNKEHDIAKSQKNALQPQKRRQMSLFNQEGRSKEEQSQSRKKKVKGTEFHRSNKERRVLLGQKEESNYGKEELRIKARTELSQVQWDFYHTKEQLQSLSAEKINRLTNKVRQWIAKKNHELDLKINQVLRNKSELHSKPMKPEKSKEEVIQFLQAQIINNESTIVVGEKEEMKLRERTYDCQQEEYEANLIQQITILKGKIKEYQKVNAKLKQHTERYDDKLKDQADIKPSAKMETLKSDIIIEKNQNAKNQSILTRLQSKMEDISENMLRQQNILEAKIDQARDNKILLADNDLAQTYKELKDRADRLRTQNLYLDSKYSKLATKTQNELKVLRNELKHYDRDCNQIEEKMLRISEESLTLLEQHKENSKIIHIYAHFSQFFSKYSTHSFQTTVPFETRKEKIKETNHTSAPKNEIKQEEGTNSERKQPQLQPTAEEECSNQFMNMESPKPALQLQEVPKEESQQEPSKVKDLEAIEQTPAPQIAQEQKKEDAEDSTIKVAPRRFRLKKNQFDTNQLKI